LSFIAVSVSETAIFSLALTRKWEKFNLQEKLTMTTLTFDIQDAVETLAAATGISGDEIAHTLAKQIEDMVEDALFDPESYFRHDYRFWRDLNRAALVEEEEPVAA
jgi:hypothetical protein